MVGGNETGMLNILLIYDPYSLGATTISLQEAEGFNPQEGMFYVAGKGSDECSGTLPTPALSGNGDVYLYVADSAKGASKREFRFKGGPVRKWAHPEYAEVVIFLGQIRQVTYCAFLVLI